MKAVCGSRGVFWRRGGGEEERKRHQESPSAVVEGVPLTFAFFEGGAQVNARKSTPLFRMDRY